MACGRQKGIESNGIRRSTIRGQHQRKKHNNPTEEVTVHSHPLSYWSGRNTKYNTLTVNPRRQVGANLPGFKGGFDPSEVLDKLLNDIPLGFELTKEQKEAVMREQDRREEKARKKMRTQKEYNELVERGGAW